MKQRLKKGLAAFLVVAMIMPVFQFVSGNDDVVQASDNLETSGPIYGTEIALGEPTDSVYTLQADALERGMKYKLVVTAETAPTVTISNNGEDGNPYDGLTQYVKIKTMSETDTAGEFAVLFETAPVAFSNVTLSISGVYTMAKLYEVSRVEISGVSEKNQLVVNGTATLAADIYGLEATTVTWSSSNSDVATVVDGVLTAKQVGKTEITATVTEGGVTYEDYFELYVVNETLETSKYGLISDVTSPADFTLQIPSGEDVRVLQISDTQIMSMENIRGAGTENAILTGSGVQRWGTENALYENCNYYIDKTFEKLSENGTLPHLVVLTGDNTYGNFDDAGTMLDALIAKMDEKCNELGIYWTFVFGNHDKESDIGIENILRKYSNSDRCLYAYHDVTGDSNMSVAIKQDGTFKQMVYLFDTNHTGSGEFKGNRVDEYAWMPSGIHDSQFNWFKNVADSKVIKDVPSTVWMHIAFEEYKTTFETKYGTESEHVYATNEGDLGERHGTISIWDDNTNEIGTDFYKLLKNYNVTGVFCGHNHTNSFSIMSDDDIRLTFGMKTGTYDEYWQGMLGGTLATTTDAGLVVEHVDVVDDTVEDFDVAGPYGQDETTGRLTGMKTASMTAWWGADMWTEIIDETDGGKAIKLTCKDNADGADGRNFVVRIPDIKRGGVYRVTYELSSDTKVAARPEIKTGSKTTQGDVYYKSGTNTIEFTFISTVDAKRSDTAYPELAIWFWNMTDENTDGESITIDDFVFEEIQAKSGDYNNDSVIDVRDVIRVKRHLGNTTNIAAAYTAEQTGDGKITNEDTALLRYRMLRMKTGSVTENDDGTFEGLTGNISLYTAHQISGAEGNGWSSAVTFTERENADGKDIVVTSNGTHSYDYLYIKVDTPIKKDCKYSVSMDLTALDDVQATGTWGYFVCTPDPAVTSTNCVQWYKSISAANLFKDNATIEFTSNGNYDCFYILLREAKDSSTTFNFAIDNIEFSNLGYAELQTILNDDGTFEGNTGIVSLLAPDSTSGSDVQWASDIALQKVDTTNGTAVKVTSTGSHNYDYLYIKMDTPVKSGCTYTINMDVSALDAIQANGIWGYFVCDSTAKVTEADCIQWYKSLSATDLFKEGATFEFTAQKDSEYFYLVFREASEDSGQTRFNFTLDNITLKMNCVLNDDGTFEGVTGNVSLYSAKDVSSDFSWAKDLIFSPVSTEKGNSMLVKTNTDSSITNTWDMLAIKFDQEVKNGVTYEVSIDLTPQDDTQVNGGWYYAFTDSTGLRTGGHAFKDYTNYNATKLFGDEEATFSFTASKDDTSFYMILFENSGNAQANYTIDNITFKEVVTE